MSPRLEALLREVAAVHQSEMRKVEPDSSSARPYMLRAKRAFGTAVEECGGASDVAKLAACDESNIRAQVRINSNRSPQMDVVYALPEDAIEIIIADLQSHVAEKRGRHRAG